ncbi:MAG TPA: ABC transporter substrate-binding protein [Thermomicrobiaceae bacterium]|nr:ABC transporter substrate-binding protein [Thermomicrobiaceae bacterium]
MTTNAEPSGRPEGPLARQITRRTLLRLSATAGSVGIVGGLLAACSSQPSNPTSSNSTSSTSTTTTQSSTGAGATSTTGSPTAGSTTTTAQATPAPAKGGTVTFGIDQEPPTFDPQASPSAITFYITSSAGESLIYMDPNRQLKPWLASSWEASSDGTSFTFKLVSGATFQDNTPFNAAAVKWNFDRVVDPKFTAGASLGALGPYKSTDVVDDATATVNFKSAYAPFLVNAATPFLALLSPTGTPKQGSQVNAAPILSGPYQVTNYVPKQSVTLKRWDGYNRTVPWASQSGPGYLDSVNWKFIPEEGTRVVTVQSGETQAIDITQAQSLPPLQASNQFKVMTAPWTGVPLAMLLVVDNPPTDELAVRQAISYAIDKDTIVNTLYKGIGTKAIGPLVAAMIDDPSLRAMYPFDVNKANSLLDGAGWKMGSNGIRSKGGKPLNFILNAIDYGSGPDPTSVLIQAQLKKVGIQVQIKSQARAPWYEDNYKGVDNGMTLFLRSGDYDALYSLFYSGNIGTNFNWARVKDPTIDQMLQQGRAQSDPTKRKALYLQLEQKIMDMAAIVPLVDQLSVFVLRSNVAGMQFTGFTYPVVNDMSISK